CDIGIAGSVDHDAAASIIGTASYVAAVEKRGAGSVDLRHEGVGEAAVESQVRPDGHGERGLGGGGESSDVGVARGVHGDAGPNIGGGAANVAGVDQDGRVEHERLAAVIGTECKSVSARLATNPRSIERVRHVDIGAALIDFLISVRLVVLEGS